MADSKRTYYKTNPEKELLQQQKKKAVEVEVPSMPILDSQTDDYQKPDVEKLPKAFFVIISGGQVREKDYFRKISVHDNFERIKLEFIADPHKLSPEGMLELAKYKKSRYKSSKNKDEVPDKIYLISDVDHFINELLRIKPICEIEGFQLIISNSCFEVWLYYAYHDEISHFLIPTNPLKISSKFKGWLPTVIRGGIKPEKAILNIYRNIENAKRSYKADENGIPVLFSTNMFLLAEDLLPLIEPELTDIIEQNNRVETEFRDRNKK